MIISIDRSPYGLYYRNKNVRKFEEKVKSNIPWEQLVELRKFDGKNQFSFAMDFFKATAYPYMALLDGEGKIIAKDLTREQAKHKIKEILGK